MLQNNISTIAIYHRKQMSLVGIVDIRDFAVKQRWALTVVIYVRICYLGISLGMGSANGRQRRYIVTSPHISVAHTHNGPCYCFLTTLTIHCMAILWRGNLTASITRLMMLIGMSDRLWQDEVTCSFVHFRWHNRMLYIFKLMQFDIFV